MAKENNTKKKSTKQNDTFKEEVKETVKKKEVKEKKKTNKDTAKKIFDKVENNRTAIITGIVCFLVATLLFRCILWPDRIAKLENGEEPIATIDNENITANMLYNDMKESYSIDSLLRLVDKIVLDKKYTDEDVNEDVKETAEYYYNMYNQYYGYTKEQFLSANGFQKEADFIKFLTLDAKRDKYFEDYVESSITDKEIQKYYKDEVTGDIDTKHILVNVSDSEEEGLTDAEAKKMAEQIIKKLNKGTSWEDIITEYKDNITDEELGFLSFNASLEANYLKEMKELKVGKYSQKPVKTSYGYHIVYKLDEKEKPALDDVKDEIIEELASEKKEKDTNLKNKALKQLREENKLTFSDTVFEKAYKNSLNSSK